MFRDIPGQGVTTLAESLPLQILQSDMVVELTAKQLLNRTPALAKLSRLGLVDAAALSAAGAGGVVIRHDEPEVLRMPEVISAAGKTGDSNMTPNPK